MGFSPPQAAGFQPKRFGVPWLEPAVASRCRVCLAEREDSHRHFAPHQSNNAVWRFRSKAFLRVQAAPCCGRGAI